MRLRHWVISFVSVAILMGAVACGSAEQEPTPAPETAPAPAGLSSRKERCTYSCGAEPCTYPGSSPGKRSCAVCPY